MNKKMTIISLAVIILIAALAIGITAHPSMPQDPEDLPTVYEWARDRALDSLEIPQPSNWKVQNTTPEDMIGVSVKTYTSGELRVTVGHNLNQTAAFSVIIQNNENTWSLEVNQDGTVQPLGVCGNQDARAN